MVNEVLELNTNSDLIFESQSLLAVAGCSNGSGKSCSRSEEQETHRDRLFLDVDGEEHSSQEKLSWTFFEEVSSLDKHLRDETTTNDQVLDGSHNDDESCAADVVALLSNSPTIIHQQSPDLLVMNTKTSPTSTYSNSNSHNNNNNNNNTARSLKAKIYSKSPSFIRKSLYDDNGSSCNIISNTGACSGSGGGGSSSFSEAGDIAQILRNADDTMIGDTGTTRSQQRNQRQSAAYVAGVDLGDQQHQQQEQPKATTSNRLVGSQLSQQQQAQQPTQQKKKLPSMGAAGRGHRIGASNFAEGIDYHLGLMGWRKKCLYTLILFLMLLIIVNLVLTLWILKVMEFSSEGMGQLKIVPGGIQLTGQAFIMDLLRASTIRSKHGQPISIESSRNFSINTRDTNGILENHLFLGHDKLECLSTEFRINDTTGRSLFSVTRDEVTIGAHALRIDGEGGAIFRESIQTSHVRAEPGRELRFESPTRQLEVTAAKDINLQSRAGAIDLSALNDVRLSALDGSIRLESAKILMPNLRTAQPPIPGVGQTREHMHRVFQLCACSNGKLFLASPHTICAGDDTTVCR